MLPIAFCAYGHHVRMPCKAKMEAGRAKTGEEIIHLLKRQAPGLKATRLKNPSHKSSAPPSAGVTEGQRIRSCAGATTSATNQSPPINHAVVIDGGFGSGLGIHRLNDYRAGEAWFAGV